MDGCSSSSSSSSSSSRRRRRRSDNDNDDDDGGGGGNKMRDGSKLLLALLTVECSMYWTLAWSHQERMRHSFGLLLSTAVITHRAPSPM